MGEEKKPRVIPMHEIYMAGASSPFFKKVEVKAKKMIETEKEEFFTMNANNGDMNEQRLKVKYYIEFWNTLKNHINASSREMKPRR